MDQDKYWDFMSRYIAGSLSLEETEKLLQWLNEDPAHEVLFAELQQIWDKSRNFPDDFSVNTQAAWQKVKLRIK